MFKLPKSNIKIKKIIACRPLTAASSCYPHFTLTPVWNSLPNTCSLAHAHTVNGNGSVLRFQHAAATAAAAATPPPSAQLEAGRRLDGVQQLVPHQVLVAELGQLEQVHAGAGGGQALQVGASVVDAEDRVELLCVGGRGGGGQRVRNWESKRHGEEF